MDSVTAQKAIHAGGKHGRRATRGRKLFGSWLASRDSRYDSRLGSMTFEEFCEDQRVRVMNSLRSPIDDQLRYESGEHPRERFNEGQRLPLSAYDYEGRR